MKTLTLIAAFAVCVTLVVAQFDAGHTLQPLAERWHHHKAKHGLKFSDLEDGYRFNVFKANLAESDKHNGMKVHGHTLGATKFSHMTNAEFKKHIKADRTAKIKTQLPERPAMASAVHHTNPPTSMDWRSQAGVVTDVQDQGQCGSCWAFSSAETARACNAIKSTTAAQTLPHLSTQQLVDCAGAQGNHGCDGGMPSWSFNYIRATGLATWASYPYNGAVGACQTGVHANAVTFVKGTINVQPNDGAILKSAVAVQPVSVVLEASSETFQNYVGGIITSGCGLNWDHAVVIVGYGTENGVDYWIVKNSWGPDWGEAGYFRLARDSAKGPGLCAINSVSVYPTC